MVFLCANTCVVHVPAAVIAHEKSRVLSFLEEVVDFSKLSAVQFVPRGLIRLTFKDSVDKERLVSQGPIMLENIECNVTPSDWPNTMVCVHYCWISCLLHQTSGVLVSKTPLHVGGHVLCCSAILYVLLLCAE